MGWTSAVFANLMQRAGVAGTASRFATSATSLTRLAGLFRMAEEWRVGASEDWL